MIIYKDILTGDEIVGDTYKLQEIDGVVYEVDTMRVPKAEEIGEINTGANPSADGLDADVGGYSGGNVEMTLELARAFQWSELEGGYQKNEYKNHIKGYMKQIKAKLEEKGESEEVVSAFATGAQKQAARLMKRVEECDVFQGSSAIGEGMLILIDYREDGETPFAIIWKHGLEEMKV